MSPLQSIDIEEEEEEEDSNENGEYSSDDHDSLQLIDPVKNLSLEHQEEIKNNKKKKKKMKKKSLKDLQNQINSIDLNSKEDHYFKRKSIRFHPYQQINKFKIKQDYNISYLKSLGYLEYSSSKKENHFDEQFRTLFVQINHSIEQIFTKCRQSKKQHQDYICNRRFH